MGKKIMIVGAGILQLPAIKKAKEMGLSVVAVDMNTNAVGFQEKGIECEVISTIDIQGVLEAAKKHQIDGIMTLASDMPMRTVARVSKELGLAGIDEQTALNTTNKVLMRQVLEENNVPIPVSYKASDQKEFFEAVKRLREKGYRCIVKPADNSGSRGVTFLKDFGAEDLKRAYIYSRECSRAGDVVVEEYMEGAEVSVETLSIERMCHVIQITDKLTTEEPYFVEMGHNQPTRLEGKIRREVERVAKAANLALGITEGPSHTEIKITKDGPKIVEVGARLGGDNITTHLVPLSTGVDMVECCIKIALGERPDIIKKFSKASAIRYMEAPKGIIKSVSGVKEASQMSYIRQINVVHGVGERSVEIRSSVDRVGFIISQADTVEQAVKACEDGMKKINFTVGE